jgi:hypothetical protein
MVIALKSFVNRVIPFPVVPEGRGSSATSCGLAERDDGFLHWKLIGTSVLEVANREVEQIDSLAPGLPGRQVIVLPVQLVPAHPYPPSLCNCIQPVSENSWTQLVRGQ